jgi:hypothetical protein
LTGYEIVKQYSKCHLTSNKVTSKLECAEENFKQGGGFQGVTSDRRPVVCKPPSKQVYLRLFYHLFKNVSFLVR